MEPAENASRGHDPSDNPPRTPSLTTATAGTDPGDIMARQMCEAMQTLPFTHLMGFARTLARDLGHGDNHDSVVRVAEALIATAAVWRIAAR